MRFETIELHNFRQYKDLTLNFKQINNNDMHILIAKNGVGKTTLLNAINWCLYGDEPHLTDTDENVTLPRLNLYAIENAKKNDIKFETIFVNIIAEEEGKHYTFRRTQRVQVLPKYFNNRDSLEVTEFDEDRGAQKYSGEEAKIIVETKLPSNIRQYYFFDGEQLFNYFTSSNKQKNGIIGKSRNLDIKQSVHAISKIDVLSRMRERLEGVIKSANRAAGRKLPNLSEISTKLEEVKGNIIQVNDQLKDVRAQIVNAATAIKNAEAEKERLINIPDLQRRWNDLKKLRETLLQNKANNTKEFFKFSREQYVNFKFLSSVYKALDMIVEKDKHNDLPPNIDKNLLKKMLREHVCLACGRKTGREEEQFINSLISKLSVSTTTSHILVEIKSELVRIISEAKNFKNSWSILSDKIKENDDALKDCNNQLETIDKEVVKTGRDGEKYDLVVKTIEQQTILKDKALITKGTLENRLMEYEKEEGELEEEYNNILKKHEELDKLSKEINFLNRAKEIVERTETTAMDAVRIRVEEATIKYYKEFIWKKDVYEEIRLNKEYKLELIHRGGYSSFGTTSAAESSLLAMAFTLALHEVSGFNALIFIDTPIARVSDENRENFAKVIREISKSKQFIMTFTPDEYSNVVKDVFEKFAASISELVLDPDSEITSISNI